MKLFRRLLIGTKDVLKGYKIDLIEIKDESFLSKGENKYQQTVIPSKDNTDAIEGTVFEISEEEMLIADKYEPNNYKRVKGMLESGREAWIYVAVETT